MRQRGREWERQRERERERERGLGLGFGNARKGEKEREEEIQVKRYGAAGFVWLGFRVWGLSFAGRYSKNNIEGPEALVRLRV